MITHPTNTPPRYIREVCIPRLNEALREVGAVVMTMTSNLFLVHLQPRVKTKWLSKLSGKNNVAYWVFFTQRRPIGRVWAVRWQEKGQQLLDMTREGNWSMMKDILSDEMLREFVPKGTYDEIAEMMIERYQGLTKRITSIPEDPSDDPLAMKAIERLRGI